MKRVWLVQVVLVALCLAAPAAWAAPTRAERAQAQEWYKSAAAHMEAQRYAKAAAAFEEAHRLDPDPALLWNIARAHHLAGQLEEAKRAFQEFVATEGVEAELRKRAIEHIAEIDERLTEQLKQQMTEREKQEKAALEAQLREQMKEQLRQELAEALAERQREADEAARREAELRGPAEVVKGAEPGVDGTAIAGWVSVGLGAALGVTALVLHTNAESLRDEVRSPGAPNEAGAVTTLTRSQALARERDANDLDTNAAMAVAVGGGALVTGLVLLLVSGDDAPSLEAAEPPPAGVSVGPGHVLFTASGRF